MTAAAPALAVLCTCGHAARMHDSDGCVRMACGCSRDRAEAAATTQADASTPLDVAPTPQTVPEPAAAEHDVVRAGTKPPVEEPKPTDPAPVSEPSPEVGAAPNPADDQTEPPAPPADPVNSAELAQALKAGRGHADPRINALAVRIEGELQALVDLLADDTAKAELQARRDQLRAELARVEAELDGTATPEADPPSFVCEKCGQAFERPQGLGAHRRYTHNGGN